MEYVYFNLQETYYEGDDGSNDDTDSGSGNDTGGNTGDDGTFTQEQVNAIIAREKKSFQASHAKTVQQLRDLQATAGLTKAEKESLQSQITELEQQSMTKAELAEREKKKLEKKLIEERDTIATERDQWRGQYTQERIRTELTHAAVTYDAFSPQQIIALTESKSELTPILDDDGKPTGGYKVLTTVNVTDDKGISKTLKVSPTEAIKIMSEDESHQNLFKGKGFGGTGGNNRPGAKKDIKTIAAGDPAAYRKARAEGTLRLP